MDGRFHLASLLCLQSCRTQDIDSSIKISRILPDGCKHSPSVFSLQHLLGFPTRGKCAAWSSHWPPLPVLTVVIVAQNSGHRCSPIYGLRAALLPTTSRSRFALTTCSVLFFPLYTFAPTTPGAQTRSFQCSRTDRPSKTICSSQSADAKFAAFKLYQTTL